MFVCEADTEAGELARHLVRVRVGVGVRVRVRARLRRRIRLRLRVRVRVRSSRYRMMQALALHCRAGDVCVWRIGVHDEGSAAHKFAMQAHGDGVCARDGWDPRGMEGAIASVDDRPAGAARAAHSQYKRCATGRTAVSVLVKRVDCEACRLAELCTQHTLTTHGAAGGRGRTSRVVVRLNSVRDARRITVRLDSVRPRRR